MFISLSPLTSVDVTDLAILANNPQITIWLRDIFPYPYTEQDARNFLDYLSAQKPLTTFGIRYQNELAGVCSLALQKDIFRKSAEIGYWVGEPFWGRGIATEAVRLICQRGFGEWGLMRIYAGVFPENGASMRVLEKTGFQLESIAKRALIKRGVIYDDYIYRMTLEEWKSLNKKV